MNRSIIFIMIFSPSTDNVSVSSSSNAWNKTQQLRMSSTIVQSSRSALIIHDENINSGEENDTYSCCTPKISLIEKNNNKVQQNEDKGKKINDKSVRFHDVVQRCTIVEEPITDQEKEMTWYSLEEIQQMKKHTRSYAKLIISIASNIINDLLNNETNDEDDNISDGDVICLRGLEKFISNHKCQSSTSSCFALSTNGKRKIMIQHVLLEQNLIKKELLSKELLRNDERIREVSIQFSKQCSDYAYHIAQKSYCFSAINLFN